MLVGTLALALQIKHPLAKIIWQEFVSTRGKLTLLQRLNWTRKDNALKAELGKLLDEARDLNDIRNAYIHALWVINDKRQVERHRNTAPGNYKKVFRESQVISAQDIQNDVLKISKLSARFLDWQSQVQGGPSGMRLLPIEKK